LLVLLILTLLPLQTTAAVRSDGVRIKELCRIVGVRENSLVGYGIVTGLAGTGDSRRSAATLQSLSNVLKSFGIRVDANQIRSRNVAAVMLTATLPPFARSGDKLDVNVASLGDAKSLLGGTLLRTHLEGVDGKIYSLAQGPVSVGGYSYDLNGNLVQKNHPTTAYIPGGAVVERSVNTQLVDENNKITYALNDPDFTTANRIAKSINAQFKAEIAIAKDAGRIDVDVPDDKRGSIVDFVTGMENIYVQPDVHAKVVINERTGTVVAGGDVKVSKVSITHGDLKLTIKTGYEVSQPNVMLSKTGEGVKTQVIPHTSIDVKENQQMSVSLPGHATVTDLVSALNRVKATSRDIITILQSVKRAGGLHAELIIQ